MNKLRITCEGAGKVDFEKIDDFQGGLKELSPEDFERLKGEMDDYGFNSPIHVWKHKGKMHNLDGHQRVMVLRALRLDGWSIPHVPVDYIKAKTMKDAKHILLSRVSQYGKVNPRGLYDFLEDSQIHISEAVSSFQIPEIDMEQFQVKFFVDPEKKKKQDESEDEVPDKAKARCKTGDTWILGEHRLLCGDATSVDDADKLMDGAKADMVFTSPPYNIGKHGFEKKGKYERDKDNKESFSYFLSEFLNTWSSFSRYQFVNLQFVSKNKIALIEWCYRHKDDFIDLICCKKDTTLPAMEKNILNADFELVYVFGENPKTRHIKLGKEFRGQVSNVVDMKRNRSKISKDHRAGFVIEFPLYFINELMGSKETVADPFGGTGTTLIACEKTSRKCFMMEIDPHYCDVIIQRWENYSGKKAKKEKR